MNNVSLISAISLNRCIGKDNKLPWRVSSDLKRFKLLTTGKICIMGRKTYESIGKPLPNRGNIVLTKNETLLKEVDGKRNLAFKSSLPEALESITPGYFKNEIMIIGGGSVYQQALDLKLCDRIYLTTISVLVDGDAFFPDLEKEVWKETYSEDTLEEYFIKFQILDRKTY
jgi:dihydrofolate reductase